MRDQHIYDNVCRRDGHSFGEFRCQFICYKCGEEHTPHGHGAELEYKIAGVIIDSASKGTSVSQAIEKIIAAAIKRGRVRL